MRVPLHFLLISLIFYNCSTSNVRLTDLDKMGLKKQVKYSKFENELAAENEKVDRNQNEVEGIRIDNEFFFNKNGMISEQRQYSSSELSQILIFKYDDRNRLISKKYYNADNELVTQSKFENTLNSNGRISKQTEFKAIENASVDSTKIIYKKTPNASMEFSYNQHGELNQMTYSQSIFGPTFPKNIVEYKNGLIDKLLVVDSEKTIISSDDVECLEFDQEGNCLKLKTTDNYGTEEYTNVLIQYYK